MKKTTILTTLIILSIMLSSIQAFTIAEPTQPASATITTNKADYSPVETVYITGQGFLPFHIVSLTLSGPSGFMTYSWTSKTDENGTFQTTYSRGLMAGDFSLTATDGLNTASTTFSDYALKSFTFSPDPSNTPLIIGHTYQFLLTATLPGGSGSNGVEVFITPESGEVTPGITIDYIDVGYGTTTLLIPPQGSSASTIMTITIGEEVTPGPLPLIVAARDNPGGGGTIIGTFTVTLHVNQARVIIQTNGLPSSSQTNIYNDNIVSGTAYDGSPCQLWYTIDANTGTAVTGTIGVDSAISGSGIHYNFAGWTEDNSPNPHPSITINISETDTGTLTANYSSNPNPVTHFDVVASPSAIVAGEVVSVIVTAKDAFGSTVTAYTGIVSFSSSDSQAVLPASSSLVNGVGSFSITLKIAGLQTITATETTTSVTGTSNAVTVSAGGSETVTHFEISAPTSVTANDEFSIVVTAKDAFENTVTAYSGNVVLGSSDSLAILPSLASLTDGTGTFSITLLTVGAQTITVTDNLAGGSATINVAGAKISGYAFNDANANGLFDASETGLSGWTITLNTGATKTTDTTGYYEFLTLQAGDYIVSITQQTSWMPSTPQSIHVNVEPGNTYTINYGNYLPTLDHIVIEPKTSTVNAGIPQSYTTTAYDTFGRSWTVTPFYSCPNTNIVISDNTAYSNTAGTYTITATYNGKTDTATLTVTGHLPTITSIAITPKTASILSGTSQTFTVKATDGYNTWDVTNQVIWNIETAASGSWNQATGTYTSANAGTWTVQASLGQLSDTATLTVNANPALFDHISINPKSSSIPAGTSQSFTVTAYDEFGNSLGDVTSQSTLDATGASVIGNSVTASNVDSYIVTATYNGLSDTATLEATGYTVTFQQTGLPLGTSWSISFGTNTYTSTTDTITINDLSAQTYSWSTSATIQNDQTRYVASLTSGSLSVPSQLTQVIDYATQCYLTVNSAYGNPTGQGWYNAGSSATIAVTQTINSGTSTRYIFKEWSGNGYSGSSPSISITISSPTTQTATWQTQNLVTYATIGNDIETTLPINEWVNHGEPATGQFIQTITNQANDTRCLLQSDNRPTTINKPTTITAIYQTQYLVTYTQKGIEIDGIGTILSIANVTYEYTQLPNSTWINKGENATFTYRNDVASSAIGKQYILANINATAPTTIEAPTTIQATYEIQYTLFTVAGTALLIFLLLLLLILLLARRRKKKNSDENPKTTRRGKFKQSLSSLFGKISTLIRAPLFKISSKLQSL